MYLSGDDNLTATERARMQAIAERLHWLGLAIVQATVSGMWAEVNAYTQEKKALFAEQTRIRNMAVARGGARKEAAEAGPFGINTLLKDIPKYLALAGAAYLAVLYFTRRR